MTEKWYNSDLAYKLGIAGVIVAVGLGGATFLRGCSESCKTLSEVDAIETRARNELRLQEADLNGNGIADKFYSIDGKIALVELDGKPIFELYQK